ncbi:hypothetical protein CPC08DRAFT_176006 [Agrocybe pediades]|nr:hypothetical protein CPC08DRAFT_176006 [Agrocybe pediades]
MKDGWMFRHYRRQDAYTDWAVVTTGNSLEPGTGERTTYDPIRFFLFVTSASVQTCLRRSEATHFPRLRNLVHHHQQQRGRRVPGRRASSRSPACIHSPYHTCSARRYNDQTFILNSENFFIVDQRLRLPIICAMGGRRTATARSRNVSAVGCVISVREMIDDRRSTMGRRGADASRAL